jgi:hypothetical protein
VQAVGAFESRTIRTWRGKPTGDGSGPENRRAATPSGFDSRSLRLGKAGAHGRKPVLKTGPR